AQLLLGTSRGAALGDLDNDGSIDIVVVNRDGPVHLLRHIVARRGNWIMLRVLNRKGLEAINASVRIEAGQRAQFREVMPNQGYCSSHDPRIHFGLGSIREVSQVTVRWPK